jgi:hypothetical protein
MSDADPTLEDIVAKNLSPEDHTEAIMCLQRMRGSMFSARERANARKRLDQLLWGVPGEELREIRSRLDALKKSRAEKGVGPLKKQVATLIERVSKLEELLESIALGGGDADSL